MPVVYMGVRTRDIAPRVLPGKSIPKPPQTNSPPPKSADPEPRTAPPDQPVK